MRVLAAILILAWSCRVRAFQQTITSRVLHSIVGDATNTPVRRVLDCTRELGVAKCLNAFSLWRAEKALTTFAGDNNALFNLTEDIQGFSWKTYKNWSDDELYSQLCDDTKQLLQYRTMLFNVPGYKFELGSKGNGTLNIDVISNNDGESGRGMKKMQKTFYKIVPFLLLPGLLMSAVLPFVLPALKMMTVAVGILNNMALTGAVFTLLRNNAFNDRYEHKVLYVNEGYKNEKRAKVNLKPEHHVHDDVEYDIPEKSEYQEEYVIENDNHHFAHELNSDWIKDYYGDRFVKI
ncbi:uncharacterized protein LOC110385080 [Bombyx mori]|uniref:Osiris 18 n=1 Tax=Bombyx mori TaxID=7091 RepID=A0A8R2DLT8_BOMMO|nr:uncharacterized protein LOC110385080 [Bombyx mori]